MKASSGVIGSLNKVNGQINVFGGGICGLIFAYKLKTQGFRVRLFEKAEQVGGKIQTFKADNGIVEAGANAVYSSPEVLDLLNELNINYIEPKEKLKKLIYRDSKVRSFPLYFSEVLLIFFRLLKKIPQNKEISIKDFFKPLLGEKVCNEVLSCVFNGVYATSIDELDFKSIFKEEIKSKRYIGFLFELKKNKKNKGFKPKSLSFVDGMKELINRLKDGLGFDIENNSTKILDPNQLNIICTDAKDAASLLQESYPSYSKILSKIDYTKLNTTTVFTDQAIEELKDAFGILFPYSETKPLGILNNSEIFKHRTYSTHFKSYTYISKGKNLDPFPIDIKEHKTIDWQRALPVYNINRRKRIKELRAEAYNHKNNVVLFGNYVDGISIREMISHINNFINTLKLKQEKDL